MRQMCGNCKHWERKRQVGSKVLGECTDGSWGSIIERPVPLAYLIGDEGLVFSDETNNCFAWQQKSTVSTMKGESHYEQSTT